MVLAVPLYRIDVAWLITPLLVVALWLVAPAAAARFRCQWVTVHVFLDFAGGNVVLPSVASFRFVALSDAAVVTNPTFFGGFVGGGRFWGAANCVCLRCSGLRFGLAVEPGTSLFGGFPRGGGGGVARKILLPFVQVFKDLAQQWVRF